MTFKTPRAQFMVRSSFYFSHVDPDNFASYLSPGSINNVTRRAIIITKETGEHNVFDSREIYNSMPRTNDIDISPFFPSYIFLPIFSSCGTSLVTSMNQIPNGGHAE
jgi:hypothetical protein